MHGVSVIVCMCMGSVQCHATCAYDVHTNYNHTKMGGHLTIFISNNGSYKCSDTFIFQYYYL